jgi:hypothetical protein
VSDVELGIVGCIIVLGSLGFVAWQWKSKDLVDPLLSGFARDHERSRKPLLWYSNGLYAFLAIIGAFIALKMFKVL